MLAVANALKGQLTCTLHMDDGDTELAQSLLPVLERKAGRILANGFPTGVEVCDSMVHGGPFPASTNFGATSVGTMSIRRFLRPVCYQNIPAAVSAGRPGVSRQSAMTTIFDHTGVEVERSTTVGHLIASTAHVTRTRRR